METPPRPGRLTATAGLPLRSARNTCPQTLPESVAAAFARPAGAVVNGRFLKTPAFRNRPRPGAREGGRAATRPGVGADLTFVHPHTPAAKGLAALPRLTLSARFIDVH